MVDWKMILDVGTNVIDTGLKYVGIKTQKEVQLIQTNNQKEVQTRQIELSKSAQELQRSQIALSNNTIATNLKMAEMRKDETMATLFVRMQELNSTLEQKALDRALTEQEQEKNRALNKYLKHIELEAIAENQARQLAHTSQENSLNRALTVQENSLNRALTEAIETLKLSQQMTIHNDNLALQNLKIQMDEKLLILSKTMDAQNAIALAEKNHALRINELKAKYRIDNSPINNLPCDLAEIHKCFGDPFALMFIVSPAVIHNESSQIALNNTAQFPKYQLRLERDLNKVQSFYKRYDRNIQLKTGEWESNFFRGTSAIDPLYLELSHIPTAILESNVENNLVFNNIYWWESVTGYDHFDASTPINWQDQGTNIVPLLSLISCL